MTSSQYGAVVPIHEELHRLSRSSPQQLKSCLRKSKVDFETSMQSTQASTASRTASTALSSPLHCQPQHDASTIRTRADAVLNSTMSPISESVQNKYHDSERQFMRISNYLVTEYNKGNCRTPADAKRLIHRYLPSYQQLKQFHNSLSRNISVLPMFPEPGEHISFGMTRCIHRVFGPILTSEVNGYDPSIPNTPTLGKSAQNAMYQPIETATLQMARDRHVLAATIIDQPPPVEMVDEQLFPPPVIQRVDHTTNNNRHYSTYPNVNASTVIPKVSNGSMFRSARLTIQTSSPSGNSSLSNSPLFETTSPERQANAETPPLDQKNSYNIPSPPTKSSMKTSTCYLPADTPPPQPLPFFSKTPSSLKQAVSTTRTKDLKSPSHDSISQSSLGDVRDTTKTEDQHDTSKQSFQTPNNDVTDKSDKIQSGGKGAPKTNSTSNYTQYQRLSSKDMLPPIIPRDDILYYPMSATQPSSPCCFSNTPPSQRRRRRPPTYLQLYIKCERSEPFVQPDPEIDVMTWYRNGENHVTADRTLVVRGTTSLYELIRAITFCFGLSDSCYVGSGRQTGSTAELLSSLGCYNGVCFLSDVKTSSCPDTSRTQLTPLPIPGFYYKYVPRGLTEGSKATDLPENGSSVLSNDPVGLQRTCVAQLFDTPLFGEPNYRLTNPPAGRTRLAFVYCTPKRQAYLSSRTQRGILPETIYHFQIMLEGFVDEEDLPSSFQTQIPIRCVGGVGGVHGGNVVDTPEEINELNRELWGDRDVIGLLSPSADPEKNFEKIIGILGTPLFDPLGHQAYKENVVGRCLYHICSGRLSMTLAEKTQGTVNAVTGTTDWLARQVEQFAKSISKKANSCMDEDLLCIGNDFDQKLEALVTKVLL